MDRPLFLGEMGQLAVICWDRQASQIIGHFSPRKIRWFRDHVGAFRDAVSLDRDWRDLAHYLVETLDITEITQEYDQHLPATIPQSKDVPAWSVVRPKISRIFSEHMLADADLVLGSLLATGGVVVLPDARHV
jgi:hypothetical protein